MATIREYLTSRLTKAQELAGYTEYIRSITITSLPPRNAYFPILVGVQIVEKLVSYNGQEKIIAQYPSTIDLYVPHEAPNPIGIVYTEADIQLFSNTVTKPLNTCINEVTPILDVISQITTKRREKEGYLSSNTRASTEIEEVEQKTISYATKIISLKPEIEKFNIKDNISKITPEQRSHILIKIWNNNDAEFSSIKAAIKECGINSNYVDHAGNSLIGMALLSNDDALFELLMAQTIDFHSYVGNKIISQLILESANKSFIDKMFASKLDLSKSVLTLALNDDADNLEIVFQHRPELAGSIYSSYPLLVLALKNGCYKAADQLLKANPSAVQQLFKISGTEDEYTALSIMVLTENKAGIELLKAYGADLSREVKNAVADKRYSKYLMKILTLYPEMIDSSYDGNTLLHLACKNGNGEIVKMILQKDLSFLNKQNSEGQTALHILFESSIDIAVKIQIARTILKLKPDTTLKDYHGHTVVDLAHYNTEFLSVLEESGLLGESRD